MYDSVRIFICPKPLRPFCVHSLIMPRIENDDKSPQPDVLKEGLDYYLENGYWVFTEYFLLRRGHCCGSGCRHCPYRKRKNGSAPAK